MPKFLVVGDVHLKDINSGLYREQPFEIRDLFLGMADIAIDRKVDAVILTGDVSDKPNPSNFVKRIFLLFLRKLFNKEIKVIMVTGSHDSYEGDSWFSVIYETLSLLDREKFIFYKETNYTILDLDGKRCSFTFLPWNFKSYELNNAMDLNRKSKFKFKFLVAHLSYNLEHIPSDVSDEQWQEMNKVYDAMFFGHYHKFKDLGGKAWYGGSVYSCRNKVEERGKRFIYIWENGEIEKIQIKNPCKYKNIFLEEEFDIESLRNKIVVFNYNTVGDFDKIEKIKRDIIKSKVTVKAIKLKKINSDDSEIEKSNVDCVYKNISIDEAFVKLVDLKGLKIKIKNIGLKLLS